MKRIWKGACALAAAVLPLTVTIIYVIIAPIEMLFGAAATLWIAGGLDRDYRDDPAYKRKLQALIERNRTFEEERERSEKNKSLAQ